jgi:hypothetical protein
LLFVRERWLRGRFRRLGFVDDLAEEYAKQRGLDLVISGALLDHLVLPPGVEAQWCGELDLRGKEARVVAYGLTAGGGARV